MTKFSTRLRRVMEDQGASIRSIAAKSGLKDVEIWEYLQERGTPGKEKTRQIARALGVSAIALSHIRPPPRYAASSGPGVAPPSQGRARRRRRAVRVGGDPLERTARRQAAVISLLIQKGIISKGEWDTKMAAVGFRASR